MDFDNNCVLYDTEIRSLHASTDRSHDGGCQHSVGQCKERQRARHSLQRGTQIGVSLRAVFLLKSFHRSGHIFNSSEPKARLSFSDQKFARCPSLSMALS